MIGTKDLLERVQALALNSANLTDLQISQLAAVEDFLNRGAGLSVATIADLPNAAANEGRLVYVVAEEDFYFSYGSDWTTVFDTSTTPIKQSIYAVGQNSVGRLGDNTIVLRSSPVTVVGGITGWSQISAGGAHSLGISNGTAYAWGINSSGVLGDGTTISRSSPVVVVGGITDWSQLSAGQYNSAGISSGVVYTWGSNSYGEAGTNSLDTTSSPVTVVGGITGWTLVSLGQRHALGIANGIAYAWGSNTPFGSPIGQLGDGTVINKSSPVTVVGGITNWSQVSAGGASSGGVANGIAYMWGIGSSGTIGDNTNVNKSSPVTVVGGITNWSQISVGSGNHCFGITSDGLLYAWGCGSSGRLGDGSYITRSSPVTIASGITNWSQVSAGGSHATAISSSGEAYAWGLNNNGQLGDGTTLGRSTPVVILGNISSWSQISAHGNHTLIIETVEKGFNEL